MTVRDSLLPQWLVDLYHWWTCPVCGPNELATYAGHTPEELEAWVEQHERTAHGIGVTA